MRGCCRENEQPQVEGWYYAGRQKINPAAGKLTVNFPTRRELPDGHAHSQ